MDAASANQVETSNTLEDEVDAEGDREDDDATPPPPSAQAERSSGNDNDNVRQVSREEAASYAQECGLLFFEASAKTGAHVGEVFTEIGMASHLGDRR